MSFDEAMNRMLPPAMKTIQKRPARVGKYSRSKPSHMQLRVYV